MEVTKQFRAEIAHRLPNHPGACQFIHGHSYLFEITVTGVQDPVSGMVCDFKELKSRIQQAIGHWDHSLILAEGYDDFLIDTLRFLPGVNLNVVDFIPTAENMAQHIANRMIKFGSDVTRVRVWETTTSYADWTKEQTC